MAPDPNTPVAFPFTQHTLPLRSEIIRGMDKTAL
jgi:hypothetical protein